MPRNLNAEQVVAHRERYKQYYARNREEILAKVRERYADNRLKEKARQRLKYLRRKAREQGQLCPLSLHFILRDSIRLQTDKQRLSINFLLN
ncbi:hypothetical protein THRCLA_22445 [Thraustotheca clavata]|uniref:Uncharacterized protein n=1 Tax=Thraustotheca clavata TaxID=74557 RepID=A0A1V9Z0U5_9STRA|nr:hypothetical protein THRCLA_22445 [Thraustotheca clavata]